MRTYLRRALPALLVGGGLVLTVGGVLRGTAERTMPGALLLLVLGAAVHVYLHLDHPRRAAPAPLTVPGPVPRVVPVIPTQRTASRPVIPSPRPAPAADHPFGGAPGASAGHAARSAAARRSGTQRAGLRHRVRPHGGLPHQRRAPDGS